MTLTRTQASAALPGWRYLLGRMQVAVRTNSFAAGLELVNAIGAVAEEQNHHPEIDLRYPLVHVAVSSHDVGGITERDVRFGEAVSKLIEERGLAVEHGRLTEVEIAIDAMDIPGVLPFWQAVTDYVPDGDDALVDPDRIGPSLWFQQMDEPRPQRNRIHLDITVAHDEAEQRRERALLAGGRLVSDESAPSFWVLADAEGNEACICTWQDRD
ncbi:VOC family protein [Cumulibacter manganitolerans]|uniref:VOC family protein n=1 Tax=Cumulibacter manganitolerans TaxID=1884992 RepID=UPI001297B1E2|nr:VOC family protein [Cumulibacter manganitolerans]